MNIRLKNETALGMAQHCLEAVQHLIRPEEYRDAFDTFFIICLAGLETYEQLADRIDKRLRPLDN